MTDRNEKSSAGCAGLVAILIAILIGVLVGVFYGRPMWLASGGPEQSVVRLQETLAQKNQRAEALDIEAASIDDVRQQQALAAEADRLRSHLPQIQHALDQMVAERQAAESVDYRLAGLVWELTDFVGDLFLQLLKLLVLPLVVTSMVCGMTSLGDIRRIGRVGIWTIAYYMSTTAIAVLIGISLVQVVKPGVGSDDTFSFVAERITARQDASVLGTLLDVFRGSEGNAGSGMFPSNLVLAASQTNVLALIAFAMVFGGTLTTLGEKGRVVIGLFEGLNEAVMKMVHLVMWFAPLGIYGLVAARIAENGGGQAFWEQLQHMAKYVGTVAGGLLIHGGVLVLVLLLIARRNPWRYTANLMRALLTALTTSSSSATLPVTMECVEQNNGVSQRSAGFVLPLGATINMDGTALYEAVAVVFIAQSLGIDLHSGQLVVIFLTATLAAVGAAGIPQAGLVTMVLVLSAVGLPISGMGMILAIDWFLDRLRTTTNVYGDAVGAAVIDRMIGGVAPPTP